MKRFELFVGLLLIVLSTAAIVRAEDVVYLKDGSVIHGTIVEEVPGVSIKIQTDDGNVFFYKVKAVEKITHSVTDQSGENSQSGGPNGAPGYQPRGVLKDDFKSDPNASFSIGSVFIGLGVMDPDVVNQMNDFLTNYLGSDSYDLTPWTYSGDVGLGWYMNHFALKWTGTYAFNWENQTYTDGYYTYNLNEFLQVYGSELEADLSLDDIQTSKSRPNTPRVTSVYLPLILGVWDVNLTTYDNYGDSDVLSGTAASFGTGVGVRFIDENHNMFDMQLIYRWSNSEILKDEYGYSLDYAPGKYIDSSVSGLAFNINYGITF